MTAQTHFQSYWLPGKAIHITSALLLTGNLSLAQDTAKTATNPIPLQELKGFTQTFYYSPGHQESAKNMAVFMERAGRYFLEEIAFTPKTTLYLLAPQDWKAVAAKPLHDVYGFPHNIDHVRLAIAAKDNDFWRSFLPPC